MSRAVWQHKCHGDVRRQAWNLRQVPEDFLTRKGSSRLYVAIRGQWRGYFALGSFNWNPADARCPFLVTFDPRGWTPILPVPAPPPDRRLGYTLAVPSRTSLNPTGERDRTLLREEGGNEKKQRERKRD